MSILYRIQKTIEILIIYLSLVLHASWLDARQLFTVIGSEVIQGGFEFVNFSLILWAGYLPNIVIPDIYLLGSLKHRHKVPVVGSEAHVNNFPLQLYRLVEVALQNRPDTHRMVYLRGQQIAVVSRKAYFCAIWLVLVFGKLPA